MSTLTQSIQDAIERARTHPNSKERNKVISRLEDAHVWAERLERNSSDAPIVQRGVEHPSVTASMTHCKGCKPDLGMFVTGCPVHGS